MNTKDSIFDSETSILAAGFSLTYEDSSIGALNKRDIRAASNLTYLPEDQYEINSISAIGKKLEDIFDAKEFDELRIYNKFFRVCEN